MSPKKQIMEIIRSSNFMEDIFSKELQKNKNKRSKLLRNNLNKKITITRNLPIWKWT
jgi:hypothetical protein